MKLTEQRLKRIIKEEIYEGELLRNTQVGLRIRFPKREFVSYDDIYPMVRIFKKNTDTRLDFSKFSIHRMEDRDVEIYNADIVGMNFTANAADLAYSLNRINDLPDVSMVTHAGEMGIENRSLMIYPNTEGEGFPLARVNIGKVTGAMKDERGYNAREAIVRAFGERLNN